jgi:hypothetical protein
MLKKKLLMLLIILGCVGIAAGALAGNRILAAPSAPDAPDEGLAIPWWTVDTGGGSSQGGPYSLNGTAGQADAAILTGGTYSLRGGYWGGTIDYLINLPLIVR